MALIRFESVSLSRSYRERDSGGVVRHDILKEINFEVNSGVRLGISGLNGAGKTSLLRVVAGSLMPTRGQLTREGSINAMWDNSIGFDLSRSARDNCLIYGKIRGHSLRDISPRIESILNFAEIPQSNAGEPLRTYSQGMLARLLFTLATEWLAEIVLIDEGLAMADSVFQIRAKERLDSYLDHSSILIVASHSETYLKRHCNRFTILHKGAIQSDGILG